MKITEVEAIPMSVPIENKVGAPISIPHAQEIADVVFGAYRTTLVRVSTDEGVQGVGECMVRLAPLATAAVIDEIAPVLIGKDPRDTRYLWELMYGLMMNRGHQKGFFIEAISGIDIALWDIAGKARDEPIYRLLGGAQRSKLRSYASSLRFRPLPDTFERIAELRAAGFDAFKIKIGREDFDPRADLAFVRAIREHVGGETTLMVDANCGYSLGTSVTVARELRDLDILWFEEPLAPDDYAGYQELRRRSDVMIAGGETAFTRYGFQNLLERRCLSIIQPNASRSGGIGECSAVAWMADAAGVAYAPHTGSSSAVAMAAAQHLAAATPNFLIYEYMVSDWSATQKNPLRDDLVAGDPIRVEDGHIPLPAGPGLGIELNESVVQRYRIR